MGGGGRGLHWQCGVRLPWRLGRITRPVRATGQRENKNARAQLDHLISPSPSPPSTPFLSISAQSEKFGTRIFSETVTTVDLSARPFTIKTAERTTIADTVIISTGAVARRLAFPGSGEADGFWNKGISACAVCDGAAPMFRNTPLAVIGGGDTAMEEALFLTKYGSAVHVIHRRGELRASKIMQARALAHPKIKMVWHSVVEEAYGNDKGKLGGVKVKNLETGVVSDLPLAGLFFAIGHEPASKFLGGQVTTDEDGYITTTPGTVETSIPGVFAAGDVQDKKWRQAITAAGTGCMAALSAEHFLTEHGSAMVEGDAVAAVTAAKSAEAGPGKTPAPTPSSKVAKVEAHGSPAKVAAAAGGRKDLAPTH